MIQNRWREKLKEAIVFFSQNVRHPNKTMILKLLAELDFRHYKVTGDMVTNLDYYTWDWGPVPRDFFFEISEKEDIRVPVDFKDALDVSKERDEEGGFELRWVAKRKPNLRKFSPRQQQILKEVAEIYRYSTAREASKASHEVRTPWTRTLKTKGAKQLIEPSEVTDAKPEIKERGTERKQSLKEFIDNYGLRPDAGN
jgi:hypothetical protein